jgi:hypothetical protein
MSSLQPEPLRVHTWVALLLCGLALLMCVAPASALTGSLLFVSQPAGQSPVCGADGGVSPPATDRAKAATTSISLGDCGIDPRGNAIVAWALAIAAHLYPCPDIYIPGQLPPYMDVCYDGGMPAAVIRYWEATCPGCREWQNGNLQCVMSVLAAFGLGGAPASRGGQRHYLLVELRSSARVGRGAGIL